MKELLEIEREESPKLKMEEPSCPQPEVKLVFEIVTDEAEPM